MTIADPDAQWAFAPGAPVLEVWFPRVFGAHALEHMGVEHIDIAFNTHPHDDHIVGFQYLYNQRRSPAKHGESGCLCTPPKKPSVAAVASLFARDAAPPLVALCGLVYNKG